MTVAIAAAPGPTRIAGGVRKRKAHAKSRNGCANCKLRGIKCDEAKPECRRCVAYGVSCADSSMKLGGPALDLAAQGAFQVVFDTTSLSRPKKLKAPIQKEKTSVNLSLNFVSKNSCKGVERNFATALGRPISCNSTILAALNNNILKALSGLEGFGKPGPATNAPPIFLDERDLATFQRFQYRTVLTVGTAKTNPLFSQYVVPMAFKYPFLLHTLLTLTLLHDDHLALPQSKQIQARTTLHHHWTLATHLFQHVLSQPFDSSSGSLRDALWATATLLGSSVVAYIEPGTDAAEETAIENKWPLKPSEPSDLNWLGLSAGKQAIWKIAQPGREGSIWSKAVAEIEIMVHEEQKPKELGPQYSVADANLEARDELLRESSVRDDGLQERWETSEGAQYNMGIDSVAQRLPPSLAATFDVDAGATLASALEMRDAALKTPDAACTSTNPYTLPLLVLQRLRSLRTESLSAPFAMDHFPFITSLSFPSSNSPAYPSLSVPSSQLRTPLGDFRCTQSTLIHYLRFIAYLPPTFKALLENKDPRALLLLRWWYELLEDSEVWWLTRRARVEGRAISVYLRREGWGDVLDAWGASL